MDTASLTITLGWWCAPAAITLCVFGMWLYMRDSSTATGYGAIGAGIVDLIGFMGASIVSLIAWLVWSALT